MMIFGLFLLTISLILNAYLYNKLIKSLEGLNWNSEKIKDLEDQTTSQNKLCDMTQDIAVDTLVNEINLQSKLNSKPPSVIGHNDLLIKSPSSINSTSKNLDNFIEIRTSAADELVKFQQSSQKISKTQSLNKIPLRSAKRCNKKISGASKAIV